jgi:hypothetical protein
VGFNPQKELEKYRKLMENWESLKPEQKLSYNSRGVGLIYEISDEVQYNETGNQVTIVKRKK